MTGKLGNDCSSQRLKRKRNARRILETWMEYLQVDIADFLRW